MRSRSLLALAGLALASLALTLLLRDAGPTPSTGRARELPGVGGSRALAAERRAPKAGSTTGPGPASDEPTARSAGEIGSSAPIGSVTRGSVAPEEADESEETGAAISPACRLVVTVRGPDGVGRAGLQVRVRCEGNDEPVGRTDASGVATFAAVPVGRCLVRVDAGDRPLAEGRPALVAGRSVGLELIVEAPAVVIVRDALGPVTGLQALFLLHDEGWASLPVESDGTVQLRTWRAGTVVVRSADGRRACVVRAEPGRPVEAALRLPDARLRGRVVLRGGRPVPGVDVALRLARRVGVPTPVDRAVTTDDRGGFELIAWAGEYELTVSPPEHLAIVPDPERDVFGATVDVELRAGELRELEVEVLPR